MRTSISTALALLAATAFALIGCTTSSGPAGPGGGLGRADGFEPGDRCDECRQGLLRCFETGSDACGGDGWDLCLEGYEGFCPMPDPCEVCQAEHADCWEETDGEGCDALFVACSDRYYLEGECSVAPPGMDQCDRCQAGLLSCFESGSDACGGDGWDLCLEGYEGECPKPDPCEVCLLDRDDCLAVGETDCDARFTGCAERYYVDDYCAF